MCIIVVVAATWAVLWIHHDRAHLLRAPGTIVKVHSTSRATFGRARFGRYTLTVQYHDPDNGNLCTRSVDKSTYSIPSAGDSVTVLIDPKTGHVESSPFPELWIVLAVVYVLMGALIWFFVKAARLVFADGP